MAMAEQKGSSWRPSFGSNAEQLEQYQIAMSMPPNEWLEIADGIECRPGGTFLRL